MEGRERRLRRRLLLAVAGALAFGCSDATEPPVPSTLDLSHESLSFPALGRSTQLVATVRDQSGAPMTGIDVTWESRSNGVAQVSPTGLVTATGNGTTQIRATAGSARATISVTVAQEPGSLQLQPDSVVLDEPGASSQLQLTVQDTDGSPIESPAVAWTSSDESVATVDETGRVTAVSGGMALVAAEAGDVSGQVHVRVVPELTLVAVSSTAPSQEVATEVTLSVRVREAGGSGYPGVEVAWSTALGSGSIQSEAVSTSDASGYATAVWLLGTAAGMQRATATVTSWGAPVELEFTATAEPGAPTSATLVADSILLSARGETAFLSPTYHDVHGNVAPPSGLTWLSRDPAVASVAADGLVTGQSTGSTWVVGSLQSAADSILVTVALRGAITVTFDDGFVSAYDHAFPVFQQVGLRGNIAVNPAQVGYPAYVTKAGLDEMHAAGFSIVSHSMTHDSLTTLTAGELDWELRESQLWIDQQGYEGSNVFIVPYHDWSLRERNAIAAYYEAARGTSASSFVPDSLVSWKPSNPYDLTGINAEDLPYTTSEGRDRLRALLQRAVDEGAFIDLFFHSLPLADVPAFEATLAVVAEFAERVLPYHELYPRFARGVH